MPSTPNDTRRRPNGAKDREARRLLPRPLIPFDVAARCDCPEPDSPEFDSTKHGLLAPPRTSYQRVGQ